MKIYNNTKQRKAEKTSKYEQKQELMGLKRINKN